MARFTWSVCSRPASPADRATAGAPAIRRRSSRRGSDGGRISSTSGRRAPSYPLSGVLEETAKRENWPLAIFEEGGTGLKGIARSLANAPSRAGALVVGAKRYATPYGASVRESFDKMDFSKLPPEDIASFAAVEVAEASSAGRAMDPKRILWWVERAFEAGQRSVRGRDDEAGQRGAG